MLNTNEQNDGLIGQTQETAETTETRETMTTRGGINYEVDSDGLRCPICLNGISRPYRTPCEHVFCADCLAEALRRTDTCPICRRPGVHNCRAFNRRCALCVAGHVPGVVTSNRFNEGISRFDVVILGCRLTALVLLIITAFWLFISGYASFELFCAEVTVIFMLKVWLILRHYPGNFGIHNFQRLSWRLTRTFQGPIRIFG